MDQKISILNVDLRKKEVILIDENMFKVSSRAKTIKQTNGLSVEEWLIQVSLLTTEEKETFIILEEAIIELLGHLQNTRQFIEVSVCVGHTLL